MKRRALLRLVDWLAYRLNTVSEWLELRAERLSDWSDAQTRTPVPPPTTPSPAERAVMDARHRAIAEQQVRRRRWRDSE